jgi:hypothetical protein
VKNKCEEFGIKFIKIEGDAFVKLIKEFNDWIKENVAG